MMLNSFGNMSVQSLKAKIDHLNEQAWNARINDSPRAFELGRESVGLARSIDYPKGLAEGLRSLGFCYVRLFKNDEALPLLQESLSLFESINDLINVFIFVKGGLVKKYIVMDPEPVESFSDKLKVIILTCFCKKIYIIRIC